MLFSSYSFVLYFLPICLLLSLALRRLGNIRFYTVFLLGASLLFYSYNHPPYLILILLSIAVNYPLGALVGKSHSYKKPVLALGIFLNLALLTYYKYTNFFIDIHNDLAQTPILYSVVLPIGISFYTFQQIMYLVDSYKQKVVDHSFLTYALYISFFPQLIAGPIVHQKHFLKQFTDNRLFKNTAENLAIGFTFFAYGLFKKIAIADQLEILFVDPVFNASLEGSVTFWEAWVGTTAYAFQIYYDFSGYSDMAFGLAKCFGIELPLNFNSPYKSKSLREFWRRWHITLSFFLRDYLYIPLGGNRCSELRKSFNIILTMFLAGLWHGAGWGFMIWGAMHGIGIAFTHWISSRAKILKDIKIFKYNFSFWALTFAFICLCWIPFRAETIASLIEIWSSVFTFSELFELKSDLYIVKYVPILLLLTAHCVFCPNLFQIFEDKLHFIDKKNLHIENELKLNPKWSPSFLWALGTAGAFYISFLLMGHVNSFIYFQF